MEQEHVEQTLQSLGNGGVPIIHRVQQVIEIMAGAKEGNGDYKQVAKEIFARLENSTVDEEVKEKAQQLDDILKQVESSPMRPATFIGINILDNSKREHATVIMDNGEIAYLPIANTHEVKRLKLGDRVMVDAKMRILVHPAGNGMHFGPEATFQRKIDDRHIEVTTIQDTKAVLLSGPNLIEQIKKGEVKPGMQIVTGAGGHIGSYALPLPEDGISHYKFLDRGSIPDVRVDRDIGDPNPVIAQIALHVREEMTRPELRRKFRLRPCITRLLEGVSGSGKTLAIQAIHRLLYEIMSEITRVPIKELPNQVFKMKTSQMLSMWFGESDKNIDRLFDEVEHRAGQKFNGFVLPVMVVLEEAEGMGRHRGGDSIYDRIMTVVLQRLDPNREGLSDKLVVFLSTTNEPHLVDPAFLRRIGGSVVHFGRLDRDGFNSVLKKHVEGLPSEKSWKQIITAVNEQLFGESDRGVVALDFQGHSEPVVKYKRDFLTGALVDRAVQSASQEAWEISLGKGSDIGLTAGMIAKSLDHQVLSVAHQLVAENVHNYLDIPDGVRVTRVRRIPQDA